MVGGGNGIAKPNYCLFLRVAPLGLSLRPPNGGTNKTATGT